MSSLEDNVTLVPSKNIVFRATPEGGIIVNLETGASFEVNGMGGEVWGLLSEGRTIAAVAKAIEAKHHVAAESIVIDVRQICAEMQTAGLIAKAESAFVGRGKG